MFNEEVVNKEIHLTNYKFSEQESRGLYTDKAENLNLNPRNEKVPAAMNQVQQTFEISRNW